LSSEALVNDVAKVDPVCPVITSPKEETRASKWKVLPVSGYGLRVDAASTKGNESACSAFPITRADHRAID
jgi:hypothetical protein